MKYTVFIPTAGIGSRLGDITKYTNKTLVKVGKKPTISYIIESYPKSAQFVIALGHFGNQVRDFLKLVYPKRHFKFVEIDKYDDDHGGLLYTFWKSRKHLQKPFIYHASDTIVVDKIPQPKNNWLAGFVGASASAYSSFNTLGTKVVSVEEKGSLTSDFIYIGLAGIHSYKAFWHTVKRASNKGEVEVINNLLNTKEFSLFEVKEWFDTGNVESLNLARQRIVDSFPILDKLEETMFVFKKSIVKFFSDENLARNRVKRAKILYPLTPKILGSRGNFYKYKFVKGQLYSKVAVEKNFISFLNWSKSKLWKRDISVSSEEFNRICKDFYFDKTISRLDRFYKTRNVEDTETIINGERIPKLTELIKRIDMSWLCSGTSSQFHGDFILDNIIKTNRGFRLLDWRQDFGGSLTAGDLYYDLAKLNHNLVINHEIVNKNLFTVEVNQSSIALDILRRDTHVRCQNVLHKFVIDKGYDLRKVQVLTAIIWLNMSPLHHHPFDVFLYYFGKYNLWKVLNEKQTV